MSKTSIIRLNAVYLLSLNRALVFLCILSTQPHSCIPKHIAIQIESITQRYPGFIYKFEQKLMKKKERKKLASSIYTVCKYGGPLRRRLERAVWKRG